MTPEKAVHSFQIIRRAGEVNKAQLPDGTWVERSEKLFVPELGGFLPCASYDNHFIYEIPKKVAHLYPGSWYMCTCGSMAVYAGLSGYVHDASPQGKMFLCFRHSNTGKHADGSK